MSTIKKDDFGKLGDVYGAMLNTVKKHIVSEAKIKEEIGETPLKDGGPQERGGFNKTIIDRKKMSKSAKNKENLYNINKLSDEDEEDKDTDMDEKAEDDGTEKKDNKKRVTESKKIAQNRLNNFMSKKSIFDRLYENVMNFDQGSEGLGDQAQNDINELGLGDATPDDELGDDSLDGGEVTLTLDRETARALLTVLQAAVGEDEWEDTGDEDMGMGDEGESEDDFNPEEDEEEGTASSFNKTIDYGKNNKVGNLKPAGGSASSAYTDKVGCDGDHGHAVHNAKQPNMGKNNKVGNLKAGKSLFDQ